MEIFALTQALSRMNSKDKFWINSQQKRIKRINYYIEADLKQKNKVYLCFKKQKYEIILEMGNALSSPRSGCCFIKVTFFIIFFFYCRQALLFFLLKATKATSKVFEIYAMMGGVSPINNSKMGLKTFTLLILRTVIQEWTFFKYKKRLYAGLDFSLWPL